MPQLTPDFDRVIIYGFPKNDSKNYDTMNFYKQMLLMQEVRMSEDYCHSDIIIGDFNNFTMSHAAKVNLTHLKKYELCVLVSALVIRNVC